MLVYLLYLCTVQITHNLNDARVSHACDMRATLVGCACHTRGILWLWLHTRGKLKMDTQVHAHEAFAHAATRTRGNTHSSVVRVYILFLHIIPLQINLYIYFHAVCLAASYECYL